jgi:phage terminase large subunit-like protein
MRQSAKVTIDGSFTRANGRAILHDWALSEGSDPEDLAAVKKANPFSRITEETLAEKRALPGMTPQHWSRFTCNVPTRGHAAAIQELEWHNAATAEDIPKDADVWVGIDVGWRWDTTAMVPLWWRDADYRLFGPAAILEPPRDGSSLDPGLVRRAFADLQARYRISTVVMDTNRAEDLSDWFSTEIGLTVYDRSQSPTPQSEDFERFMEALRSGHLFHSGDEGLRRHALNAVTRLLPNGGAKFDRVSRTRNASGKQDERVIDALVAAAMVHSVRAEPRPTYRTVSFG